MTGHAWCAVTVAAILLCSCGGSNDPVDSPDDVQADSADVPGRLADLGEDAADLAPTLPDVPEAADAVDVPAPTDLVPEVPTASDASDVPAELPDLLTDTPGIPDVPDVPDVPDSLADTDEPADLAEVADTLVDLPEVAPDLPTCEPTLDYDPCDGMDNDCDGAVDEDADCSDGEPCNGLELCVDGACQPGESGGECAVAPNECNQSGGAPGPVPGSVVPFESTAYTLYDENTWDQQAALVEALVAHQSVTPVSLDTIFNDLNRQGSKVNSLLNVECYHTGFTWNSGDQNVDYWYPQGLTGTATASPTGDWNGRKMAVVSWYHKPENDSSTNANKGVRVSFVDVDGMVSLAYRHALLVRPTGTVPNPDLGPVTVHAGGIAWFRNWLYVADTTKGLRVFDLSKTFQVQTGHTDWLGLIGDQGYHAYGYKYAIPQVSRFRLCAESCCTRFSFVAVDTSQATPALVTGEYSSGTFAGRILRWPLDPESGLPQLDPAGRVVAESGYLPGVKKLQGGLTVGNTLLLSSSDPKTTLLPSPGTLFVGSTTGGAVAERRFPYPPEDLHYSPFSDNLWCHTENPGSRNVFAVKLQDMLAGCD